MTDKLMLGLFNQVCIWLQHFKTQLKATAMKKNIRTNVDQSQKSNFKIRN